MERGVFLEDLNINIGKNLKKIRKKKGYSLANLEEITGVSKSMLGQIERGESNPTVKTLWKIAKSLNVTFSYFIEEEKEEGAVFSISNTKPFIEEDNGYLVYPLIPFDQSKGFEIYLIEIEPDQSYTSDSHNVGVEEYVFVNKGILEMIVDKEKYLVKEGEVVRFKADCPHTYHNQSEFKLIAFLLIYYSMKGI